METFKEYKKPLSKYQQAKKEAEEREYSSRKAEYDLMLSNKKKLEELEKQKKIAEEALQKIENEKFMQEQAIKDAQEKAERQKSITLQEYTKVLSKFQQAKLDYETKQKQDIEDERLRLEKNRLIQEEKQRKERESAEQIKKIKLEKAQKEEAEYKQKIKSEYDPEKMFNEIKEMVDTLANFDRSSIKNVIDQHFKDDVEKLIKDFYIVFEDIPPEDSMRQSILQLFQISLSQDITAFERANHERYLAEHPPQSSTEPTE